MSERLIKNTDIVAFGFFDSGPNLESHKSTNCLTTSSGGILPSANTNTFLLFKFRFKYMTLNIKTLQKLIRIMTLFAGTYNVGNVITLVELLKFTQLKVTGHLFTKRRIEIPPPVIRNRIPFISRKVGGISILLPIG